MNIYEKISAIMQDVQYLCKDDNIAFGSTKYKAISEEKVTSTVRASMIAHKVAIVPIEQEHSREGTLTTVNVKYRIQNTEDVNDFIIAVSSGTGVDTQDKGVGKAMTYAYKYLLLRTFAIPTGEDPDKISSAELDSKQQYFCVDCGTVFEPMTLRGKHYTASDVYKLTCEANADKKARCRECREKEVK